MIQTSLLTIYWSQSQQGHLQPHSKSKAWQLSIQLLDGLFLTPGRRFVSNNFVLHGHRRRSYAHGLPGHLIGAVT